MSKGVEFWRSLAFGGPGVCSDVLAEDDLETLHVAQDLDQFLVDRVREGYSIILTGNAGDGKTHLLMLDRLLLNPALAAYAESNVDLNFSESFRRLSQETVRKRLLGLLDRLRALGHRATVRELWIVLAQLFFGGKPEAMKPEAVAGRSADWYSERLFDPDNHLTLVKSLRRWADPASVSHPRWDLKLESAEGTSAEDWLVDRAVPALDRRRMGQRDGRALFGVLCISPQKGSIQITPLVPIRISANSRRISSTLTKIWRGSGISRNQNRLNV